MKKILENAAKAFSSLLSVSYHIVLGRKGKAIDIVIVFKSENFFHLAGLHKLKKHMLLLKIAVKKYLLL